MATQNAPLSAPS
jgi:integrase